MKTKDFLLIAVTSLAVFYIGFYSMILVLVEPKAIIFNIVLCISVIWLLLFIYANARKIPKEK